MAKLFKRLRMIKLFSLIGTDVKVHWSLLIPLAISALSLEGFIMMVTIFTVVTMHEFGHILSSKWFGIKCETVVLSCIGGAAFLDKEPETPWSELVIALCGPLVNVVLMVAAIPLVNYVPRDLWVTFMVVNAFMVTFNLLPALPMDGGRVFRATLWFVIGRRWATVVAMGVSLSLCIVGLEHAWVSSSIQLALICGFVGLMAAFSLAEKKEDDGIQRCSHTTAAQPKSDCQSVVATIVPTKSLQGNPEAA